MNIFLLLFLKWAVIRRLAGCSYSSISNTGVATCDRFFFTLDTLDRYHGTHQPIKVRLLLAPLLQRALWGCLEAIIPAVCECERNFELISSVWLRVLRHLSPQLSVCLTRKKTQNKSMIAQPIVLGMTDFKKSEVTDGGLGVWASPLPWRGSTQVHLKDADEEERMETERRAGGLIWKEWHKERKTPQRGDWERVKTPGGEAWLARAKK